MSLSHVFNKGWLIPNREPGTCRLYLDGVRLTNEMTPEDVDMEEGDLIEVHWEQVGGTD